METLYKDAVDAYLERITHLTREVMRVREKLEAFNQARQLFFEDVDRFSLDEKITRREDYYLPVWFIETHEQGTDTMKSRAVLPGDFMIDTVHASLHGRSVFRIDDHLEGLQDLLNQETNLEKIKKFFKWQKDEKTKAQIMHSLDSFFDAKFKSYSNKGLKKAFHQIVERSDNAIVVGVKKL